MQNSVTLLVVDDVPDNIQVLEEILGERYRILAALNGNDAIRVAGQKMPDLILLDVMMPGLDGFEVLEGLKLDERTRGIPVIFLTALDDSGRVSRAFQAGAADYVTKPFRREELLARIGNQIELRRSRGELEAALGMLKMQLEFAREKQQRLLPQSLEGIDGLNATVEYRPSAEIGGDFYDISRIKDDVVRICLADAEGQGVAAALVSIAIKAEYETLRTLLDRPDEVLKFLNASFLRKFPALKTYFTCVVADIDLGRDRLRFASAGHPVQILLSRQGKFLPLETYNCPMAAFPDPEFQTREFDFAPGDRMVLFSDGLFEQFNDARELFGEERLHALLNEHGFSQTIAGLTKTIMNSLHSFATNGLEDDLTLCVVERSEKVS